jgi:hypothetical protein
MRRAKRPPTRNKIDLADPAQFRALKKRLNLSADELERIITKVGNSIVAVSKEAWQNKGVAQKSVSPEMFIVGPSENAGPSDLTTTAL